MLATGRAPASQTRGPGARPRRARRARGRRDWPAGASRRRSGDPAPRTRAPPRPLPLPALRPGARRRGRREAGGGRREAGGGGWGRRQTPAGRGGPGPARPGSARPGSARPPVSGSWSALGPARAAAVAAAALVRGFGGARAPRRSHGPGDPAALAHAQRRLLLRQQQRGEPRARAPA